MERRLEPFKESAYSDLRWNMMEPFLATDSERRTAKPRGLIFTNPSIFLWSRWKPPHWFKSCDAKRHCKLCHTISNRISESPPCGILWHIKNWLVVSTPISQLEGLSHILWKIKMFQTTNQKNRFVGPAAIRCTLVNCAQTSFATFMDRWYPGQKRGAPL